MNLLLVESAELKDHLLRIQDQRALHLLGVLKVKPGDEVRTAIIGQGALPARVVAVDEAQVTLETGVVVPAPRPRLSVVLSIPRPKAVSRIIQAVSSFGAASITLINAWKVEKSYLDSPRLAPERLREDAWLGAAQGRQCHLPELRVISRFTSFLDEQSVSSTHPAVRFVMDPNASSDFRSQLSDVPTDSALPPPVLLAFGPDGGFIPREVESLHQVGYASVRLNTGPLRTEVAVAAALGALTMSPYYQTTHLP